MDDCIKRNECTEHRNSIMQEVSHMIELSESKQNLELERMINAKIDKLYLDIKELISPISDNQKIIYRVGLITAAALIMVLIGVIIGRAVDFSVFF